jgi:hypothetical protein
MQCCQQHCNLKALGDIMLAPSLNVVVVPISFAVVIATIAIVVLLSLWQKAEDAAAGSVAAFSSPSIAVGIDKPP